MKLKVVAWGDYDDDLPEGDNGWAARNAIIDEIRKNGYDFSGWHHQEGSDCTPILNDGKKYCYSQRGWGDVMAEAHGYSGATDYARFLFPGDPTDPDTAKICRPAHVFPGKPAIGTDLKDLNETFERQVSQAQFEEAEREGSVRFGDYRDLRYLYRGDTLVLACGGRRAVSLVTDAVRVRTDGGLLVLSVTITPEK